nr:hypothetical protein [Tanacetum cinerariifolium]
MTELTLEESLIMFMAKIAKRHDENFNLIKEIQAFTDFALRNQQASIKALEIQVKHDQIVELRSTIEKGEVIDTPIKEMVKTRHDDDKITNIIEDYCSFNYLDRKIHVYDAYNLRFFCIIDKLEFKGKSVFGAFMNAPIFVGTSSIVTDFAVIEDMDRYHDEEIGNVIVGSEFFKEIGVKAKRFDGMITIYK